MITITAGVHIPPPAAAALDIREELGSTTRQAVAVIGSADAFSWWNSQTGTGATIVRVGATGLRANLVTTVGRASGTTAIDWALAQKDAWAARRPRRLTWETWIRGSNGCAGISNVNDAFTAAASYKGFGIYLNSAVSWDLRCNRVGGGADVILVPAFAVIDDFHKVTFQYTEGLLPQLVISLDNVELYRTTALADFPDPPTAETEIYCPRIGGRVGNLWSRGNRLLLEYL